jgi:hypothetical protein
MLSEASAGRDLADLKVTNRKVGEKILLVIGTKGNSQKIVENASHGQRKGRGKERTDVKFKNKKIVQMWFVCFFFPKKLEFRNQGRFRV